MIVTDLRLCCISSSSRTAPFNQAELSPKRVRGALVSLNEVSINIGIVLGFLAGWAFSGLVRIATLASMLC